MKLFRRGDKPTPPPAIDVQKLGRLFPELPPQPLADLSHVIAGLADTAFAERVRGGIAGSENAATVRTIIKSLQRHVEHAAGPNDPAVAVVMEVAGFCDLDTPAEFLDRWSKAVAIRSAALGDADAATGRLRFFLAAYYQSV